MDCGVVAVVAVFVVTVVDVNVWVVVGHIFTWPTWHTRGLNSNFSQLFPRYPSLHTQSPDL